MWNKSCLHNTPCSVLVAEVFRKNFHIARSPTGNRNYTFIHADACYMPYESLSIRVCLFPSVLRNSFINPLPPTHTHTPTNISHVLAASLHAACLTKPFRVLYLFSLAPLRPLLFPCLPAAIQDISGKTRRCEEVQKASAVFPYGLTSAELCTRHHVLLTDRAGKHAQAVLFGPFFSGQVTFTP